MLHRYGAIGLGVFLASLALAAPLTEDIPPASRQPAVIRWPGDKQAELSPESSVGGPAGAQPKPVTESNPGITPTFVPPRASSGASPIVVDDHTQHSDLTTSNHMPDRVLQNQSAVEMRRPEAVIHPGDPFEEETDYLIECIAVAVIVGGLLIGAFGLYRYNRLPKWQVR